MNQEHENAELKRLLAIALRDLTGGRAGTLSPEQFTTFLADCERVLGDWRKP